MSAYYCDQWHTATYPQDLNGRTVREAYDNDACLDFTGRITVGFNSAGEITDTDIETPDTLECTDHWGYCNWSDDTYESAYNSLSERPGDQRVWLCDDCGDPFLQDTTIWESEHAFQQHSDEEHDTTYLAEQAEPNLPPTPPPATRIPADRIVIEVAPGRTWFSRTRLPDWVPPMIDDQIRAGRIHNIHSILNDRTRQANGVVWNERLRRASVYGDSRESLRNNTWADGWQFAELFPAPPVRSSHSLFPGGQP
jgi:hypothetical protein